MVQNKGGFSGRRKGRKYIRHAEQDLLALLQQYSPHQMHINKNTTITAIQ